MQQLSTLLWLALIWCGGLQAGTPVLMASGTSDDESAETETAIHVLPDQSELKTAVETKTETIKLEDQQPTLEAKFGSGITVTTANESFSLQIRGRFQGLVQVEHSYNSDASAKFGAQVRRGRFKLAGHVGKAKTSPDDVIASKHRMEYAVQLGYTNRDIVGIAENAGVLLDAYIKYKPCKSLAILAGQAKLPGNRQYMNSSQKLNFVDRGLSNAFRLDRDFGIQFQGSFGNNFTFKPTFSIATGEGRNQIGLTSSGLGYTIRTEFMPFGDFKGAYEQGDVRREESPKLAFAASYDANHNARFSRGQRGGSEVASDDRTTIHTIYTDAIFKYQGFSAFAEYGRRTVGDDYLDHYTTGNALTASAGYVCKKMFGIAVRYDRTSPLDNLSLDKDMRSGINSYSIAASKYFKGHNLKIQTDYTIVDFVNSDVLEGLWRLQFEVAF